MTPTKQRMEFLEITPEMAATWLAESEGRNFRRLNNARVSSLTNVIVNRMWEVDGNPIKFNCDGRLLDGQHRLAAIARSKIACWSWVCWGVESDITIDTNAVRSATQILAHRGEINPSRLAPALRWLYLYDNGVLPNTGAPLNSTMLLRMLKQHPGMRRSVTLAMQAMHRLGNVSMLAFIHYVASRDNQSDADLFLSQVANGNDLQPGDPVLLLRNRLIQERMSKNKLERAEKVALLIKAYNAWRAGAIVKNLRWRAVGPAAEAFPRVTAPSGSAEHGDLEAAQGSKA